jgi:hypothetical protein
MFSLIHPRNREERTLDNVHPCLGNDKVASTVVLHVTVHLVNLDVP